MELISAASGSFEAGHRDDCCHAPEIKMAAVIAAIRATLRITKPISAESSHFRIRGRTDPDRRRVEETPRQPARIILRGNTKNRAGFPIIQPELKRCVCAVARSCAAIIYFQQSGEIALYGSDGSDAPLPGRRGRAGV